MICENTATRLKMLQIFDYIRNMIDALASHTQFPFVYKVYSKGYPSQCKRLDLPSKTSHIIYIFEFTTCFWKKQKKTPYPVVYNCIQKVQHSLNQIVRNKSMQFLIVVRGMNINKCVYKEYVRRCFELWPIHNVVFSDDEECINDWVHSTHYDNILSP